MPTDPINIIGDPAQPDAANVESSATRRRALGRRWRALRWFADNIVALGGAAAVVAAILGAGGWAYVKLRGELTSYIDSKIEPYDNLLTGMALVHNADSDIAIPYLRKALNAFDRKDEFDDRLRAVVDFYMIAVMGAKNLSEHRQDMERIKHFIGKRTSELAWHQYQFGWFSMLTSDLVEAERRFQIALRESRKERSFYPQASAAWALALLRVCAGRESEALEYAKEATRVSFNQYNALRFYVESESYLQEHRIDQLSNICGKPFKEGYPRFISHFIEIGRGELASMLKLPQP